MIRILEPGERPDEEQGDELQKPIEVEQTKEQILDILMKASNEKKRVRITILGADRKPKKTVLVYPKSFFSDSVLVKYDNGDEVDIAIEDIINPEVIE